MTPKERAAMQQALEALEKAPYPVFHKDIVKQKQAITALREALAEPVSQEPIGKVSSWNPIKGEITVTQYHSLNGYKEPAIGSEMYTAPQPVKEVELTDDEIEKAVENIIFDDNFDINIARAVIAKYKEKNK